MAERNLAGTLANACKAEIEEYCNDIKPNDLEVIGCLKAQTDDGKLSSRCKFIVNDVSLQVARALVVSSYLVNECSPDLEKHCAGVKAGDGRLLECLQINDAGVSKGCRQALRDAGLK